MTETKIEIEVKIYIFLYFGFRCRQGWREQPQHSSRVGQLVEEISHFRFRNFEAKKENVDFVVQDVADDAGEKSEVAKVIDAIYNLLKVYLFTRQFRLLF